MVKSRWPIMWLIAAMFCILVIFAREESPILVRHQIKPGASVLHPVMSTLNADCFLSKQSVEGTVPLRLLAR